MKRYISWWITTSFFSYKLKGVCPFLVSLPHIEGCPQTAPTTTQKKALHPFETTTSNAVLKYRIE
jgi:hypothetical protein